MDLADLEIEPFRRNLAIADEKLLAQPEDAALKKTRARLRKEINSRELELFRQKAERFPMEMGPRFEVGLRLLRAGQLDEAIAALQAARADARYHWQSSYYLGQCFKERNNWRLAQRNFEEALQEMPPGEVAARKDVLFLLASGCAEAGDLAHAIELGLELANLDFAFREIGRLLDDWQTRLQTKVDQASGGERGFPSRGGDLPVCRVVFGLADTRRLPWGPAVNGGWSAGCCPPLGATRPGNSPPLPYLRGFAPGRVRFMADLPLVEELPPGLTPWDAARSLADLPHLLFLDSAAVGRPLGRYSFVAADPVAWVRSRGQEIDLTWHCRPPEVASVAVADVDPFALLVRLLSTWPTSSVPGLPPFQGGVAGLFGYDLCHYVERLPRPRWNEFASPDLAVGFYDCVVAFDHDARRAWLIATGLPEVEVGSRRARARERLEILRRQLARSPRAFPELPSRPSVEPAFAYPVPGLSRVTSNFDRDGYLAAVRRVVEYIHAGDCFQVNVSQRLLVPWRGPPLELYARLRDRNPAPFAGYLDCGECAIVSASPERFLKADSAGAVETRPIKGTRPRGATPEEDRRLRDDLLCAAKDRAENVMIVDLLRNDLGRSCAYGSVVVTALCRLETFPTVHHLVSEVRGQLRPGLGPIDLFRAAFPGGSVTGAPKVRAMEIIAELEPTARGAYCGSLSYVGCDGALDTNILIRSFTVSHGWAQFPVGGGVVADSDPDAEYAETLHKAEGLLRALRP